MSLFMPFSICAIYCTLSRIIPCIRIFKGSLYDFSCAVLFAGTRRKRLDFKHFLTHKTGVQLFGSSDRLYSRFLF